MGAVRMVALIAWALMVVVLTPLQILGIWAWPPLARWLPVFVHKLSVRALGVRVERVGKLAAARPLLVVSNHSSWLDIVVMSSTGPVSFVSKAEVRNWPGISILARLQRTVFVDRTKRRATGSAMSELVDRLKAGDAIVLFAEGTTNLGNTVQTFRSSLFGAAGAGLGAGGAVQPVAILYTRLHGLPIGRTDRPHFAWTGDEDLLPHLMQIVRRGTLDVVVAYGEPIPVTEGFDRKELAAKAESAVRALIAEQRRRVYSRNGKATAPVPAPAA